MFLVKPGSGDSKTKSKINTCFEKKKNEKEKYSIELSNISFYLEILVSKRKGIKKENFISTFI